MKASNPADLTAQHAAPAWYFWRSLRSRNELGTVLAALLLFLGFSLLTDSFFTVYNLFNVGRNLSIYVFIALGQAVVMVVGGMNLSLGAIGGLATITVGMLMQNKGWDPWAASSAAIFVGLFSGGLNGVVITKTKLSSFIVTLATSFIFTGLVMGISKGYPMTKIPKAFNILGQGNTLGIPNLVILLIVSLLLVWYFFRFTVTGRQLLATGGNLHADRLSGIKTDRMIVLANVLSGGFAAITALLWVSRMASAQPSTGGNWMIISFAVAVIGGTSLTGGSISPLGLFCGGLIMVLIKNGLILMQVDTYFEQTFLGSIILLAVLLGKAKEFIPSRKFTPPEVGKTSSSNN